MRGFGEELESLRVGRVVVESFEDFGEDVVGRDLVEESHRGAYFECVDARGNGLYRLAFVGEERVAHFAETGAKDRVGEVLASLVEAGDGVILGTVGFA